jgi:hypothetical protein
MLVEDTLQSMEAHLTHKQGRTTPEQKTKTFHQKVLCGNLWGGVRYLTEREKGGILYPDDIDEKTGKTVQSVLESKHPNARTPGVDALTDYPSVPDFVDLDITEDSIEIAAAPTPIIRWRWAGRDGCPCAAAVATALRDIQSNPLASHRQTGGLACQLLPTMGCL